VGDLFDVDRYPVIDLHRGQHPRNYRRPESHY
jgi:hypothetical protein